MYTMTKKADTCLIAPTLVGIDHRGSGDGAAWPVILPLTTVTKDARHALAAVTLIQTGYGERPGQAPRVPGLNKPLGTLVDGQKHAVVACAIKHYGGVVGQGLEKPLGTITKVDHHSLCTGNVVKLYGTSTSAGLDEPLPTVTKGGQHLAMAVGHLQHYYSEGGQDQALGTPMHTIPTKARHALVLGELGFNLAGAFRVARFLMKYGNWIPKTYVHLGGRYRPVVMIRKGSDWYLMTDIGLRMLQPHELAKAQGFPDDYILTGTKSEQVAKIGNSVCPPVAEALVRANLVAEAAQPYEAIA
jgi:DNA (cytosine-5)-methyltransferase 1